MEERVGLVVGKFAPYHTGHELMIKTAASNVDLLFVVRCDDPRYKSTIDHNIEAGNIRYIRYPYNDSLPYVYSDTDDNASKQWAEALQVILPKIDIVMSSEIYGDRFAKHLGAKHIMFDVDRRIVSISATEIREDPVKNWDYLTDSSKKKLMKTFVIAGGESSGKTTLFNKLKKEFPDLGFVPEVGREMCDDSVLVSQDTLREIAKEHATRYEIEKSKLPRAIIMDTDVTTTIGYNQYLFGNSMNTPHWTLMPPPYSKVLFLNNNIPFVDDGTRLPEKEAAELSKIHYENYNRVYLYVDNISDRSTVSSIINNSINTI